jgi:hypothetical protein
VCYAVFCNEYSVELSDLSYCATYISILIVICVCGFDAGWVYYAKCQFVVVKGLLFDTFETKLDGYQRLTDFNSSSDLE